MLRWQLECSHLVGSPMSRMGAIPVRVHEELVELRVPARGRATHVVRAAHPTAPPEAAIAFGSFASTQLVLRPAAQADGAPVFAVLSVPASRGRAGGIVKRHLGALALLLAIHLVVTLARGATEAVPAREPLLRADGGPIEALVVQFHRPAAVRFLAVYEQLFAALRAETRVIVVVADEEDERLFESARRGWAASPRIEYVRTGRPITSWARDRFAVLEGREGPVILRRRDRRRAWRRACTTGWCRGPWAVTSARRSARRASASTEATSSRTRRAPTWRRRSSSATRATTRGG
ncbi:MAG: hypothetical protein M5U28_37075 [Sandaracinaceae bacterium]|nr:hypothetical protein [Sandaracinaceae bacterium]